MTTFRFTYHSRVYEVQSETELIGLVQWLKAHAA